MADVIEENNQMNFIDLFAGIGGIKLGFEKIGFKSVFLMTLMLIAKQHLTIIFLKFFKKILSFTLRI